MITINGIDCHGEMHEGQNIEVVCEDEMYDGVHPEGYETWEEAVEALEMYYPDMVELTAV